KGDALPTESSPRVYIGYGYRTKFYRPQRKLALSASLKIQICLLNILAAVGPISAAKLGDPEASNSILTEIQRLGSMHTKVLRLHCQAALSSGVSTSSWPQDFFFCSMYIEIVPLARSSSLA